MINPAPFPTLAAPEPAALTLSGGEQAIGIGPDGLMLACMVLAMVALAAVVGTIRARRAAREAARTARRHSEAMHAWLRAARTAESIAGVGVWQYDVAAGVQHWSDGLKHLFRIDPDAEMVEGDAETVLFANAMDLVGRIMEHADRHEPYALQFDIRDFDRCPRTIELQAFNLRHADGSVQRVVAVARDITDAARRERDAAMEWAYDPDFRSRTPFRLSDAHPPGDIDPLTGFATRRRVMRELDRLVMDARLSQRPMVLVMFDIDRFSRVNRAHGVAAGDRVLERVAQIARDTARGPDVFGRICGEEFVWIIPDATDTMARVMTEKLRIAIEQGSAVDDIAPVTISLGFAMVQAGDSALTLFARADQALFEAKEAGRNRVRVAA